MYGDIHEHGDIVTVTVRDDNTQLERVGKERKTTFIPKHVLRRLSLSGDLEVVPVR